MRNRTRLHVTQRHIVRLPLSSVLACLSPCPTLSHSRLPERSSSVLYRSRAPSRSTHRMHACSRSERVGRSSAILSLASSSCCSALPVSRDPLVDPISPHRLISSLSPSPPFSPSFSPLPHPTCTSVIFTQEVTVTVEKRHHYHGSFSHSLVVQKYD